MHVGQTDIPVEACRALPSALMRWSAFPLARTRCSSMWKTADMSLVDYLGVGPLHETPTKTDCGLAADSLILSRKASGTWRRFIRQAPFPSWLAGVKVADIPAIAQTGVDGFFVVSAVCCRAPDPHAAALELCKSMERSEAS